MSPASARAGRTATSDAGLAPAPAVWAVAAAEEPVPVDRFRFRSRRGRQSGRREPRPGFAEVGATVLGSIFPSVLLECSTCNI